MPRGKKKPMQIVRETVTGKRLKPQGVLKLRLEDMYRMLQTNATEEQKINRLEKLLRECYE